MAQHRGGKIDIYDNFDLFETLERGFKAKEVGIVEFCESDEFCNKPLYPRQRVLMKLIWLEEMDGWEEDVLTKWINEENGVSICSKVRERRQRLRDEGYDHFREIMLVAGRRASKGHTTALSIAKKLYDTVLLGNPQKFYGVDSDKQLHFSIIASSMDQAKEFQFRDVVGAVQSCKAFDPYTDKVLEEIVAINTPDDLERAARLRETKAKIDRSNAGLVIKPFPSNAQTIRGQSAIAVVMDEMAFMLEGVSSKSSASKVYDAITPSLKELGKGVIFFQNSSPATKVGRFFENYRYFLPLKEDGRGQDYDTVHDFRSLVLQIPSWELYRDWEMDQRFKKAMILPPEESEETRAEEIKDPDTFKVEFRAQFAETTDSFLNPEKVDEIFEPWEGRVLTNRTNRSGYGPEIQFIGHADPATTTANFGLAIAHKEYGLDRDGNEVPHVVFDYVHAWVPRDYKDNTINYVEVEEEIISLISGFRPYEFSFDQFNSRLLIDSIRTKLNNRNIAGTQVVEQTATLTANRAKADLFKMAINLNLVHAPRDSRGAEIAINEMKFLQEQNGRVDRQRVGPVTTKDVFDCMAECVHSLLSDFLTQGIGNIRPAFGSGVGGSQVAYGAGQHGPSAANSVISRGHSSFSEFYVESRSMRNNFAPPTRGARGRPRRGWR